MFHGVLPVIHFSLPSLNTAVATPYISIIVPFFLFGEIAKWKQEFPLPFNRFLKTAIMNELLDKYGII
jgi:hypothetical protein